MSSILRLSRSPFYFTARPNSLVPGVPVASTITQVFIWNGLVTDITASPQYTINKKPLGVSNLIVLDLSQLVNDYLSVSYDGTYETDTYFLSASTTFFDAANVQIGTVVELSPDPIPFSKGFGLFNKGVNPKVETKVFQPGPGDDYIAGAYASNNYEITVPESEPIQIPSVVTKTTDVTISFYTGQRIGTGIPDGLSKTVILTNDGSRSDNYIQYADNIDPSTQPQTLAQWDTLVDQTWDGEIETTVNAPTKTVFWCPENNHPTTWVTVKENTRIIFVKVNYVVKDKFTPYKITFINSFGALENFWMTGAEKSSISVNGDTFKRNLLSIPTSTAGADPSYNVDAHQYVTFGEQGRKSYTLNTGLIPESQNTTLTELFLSQKIWITKYQTQEERDNVNIALDIEPVVLKSKQLLYKTHLQEKVIDYKIEFQSAHDEINQVR